MVPLFKCALNTLQHKRDYLKTCDVP